MFARPAQGRKAGNRTNVHTYVKNPASFAVGLTGRQAYQLCYSNTRPWLPNRTGTALSISHPRVRLLSTNNRQEPDKHTDMSRLFLLKSWLYSETDRRKMGIRPETLFNQAIERIKANDVQGGVRLFLKMNTLVIPRSNELGFYERAGEYLFSNDHQHDGALLWETAYRNGHKSKIMQLVLGQYYLKTGKLAEAESVLTRFSQDYPDNPRGHHELGVVYLMRALINVNNSEVFVKNKLLAQTQMLIALKCKNDANFYERMMHGFTSPQGEIQVNLRVIEMLDSKINYGEHPYEYLEFEKGISVLLNAMIKILERSNQIEIESFTKRGKSSRFGLGIGYSGSVGFKPVITYSITKTGYGIGWNSGDFMPAKSLYQFKSANSTSSHFTLTPAASETLTNLYQLADIIKAERMHELNRPNKPATQEEMAANYEQLEASRRNGPSY